MPVPPIRVNPINDHKPNQKGGYVLYWMIANRRFHYNFALERAIEWSLKLGRPLIILEALRVGYPWANDRIHQFVIDGMLCNAAAAKKFECFYYPYLERKTGEGSGLLESLAQDAALVVTDEFPCFFLPSMVAAAGKKIKVLVEHVDSNGIIPLRANGTIFPTAYAFRRSLQKNIRPHLKDLPSADPFKSVKLPGVIAPSPEILKRWPAMEKVVDLSDFKIDHSVTKAHLRGGSSMARELLAEFLKNKIANYHEARNEPEQDIASGLSPFLHFGHISSHEVFEALTEHEGWNVQKLPEKGNGSRAGWWQMSEGAEAFVDQLITWRELGYNMCFYSKNYDKYESLPSWARKSLEEHSSDVRRYVYSVEQFEKAKTHDPLWNAAQNQLRIEGTIHNYLRMLWGKKILEWSESPWVALEIMIELNNKYALDGRNPNSYSGIFWTLGRYDRPWGPEREIFGTVRYMSSENTARKVRVKDYIKKYGGELQLCAF